MEKMLPYSRGLILDNNNNYGIVKTETLFGFGPAGHNVTDPLEWILTPINVEQPLQESGRAIKSATNTKKKATAQTSKPNAIQTKKSNRKLKKKRKGKHKKCIYKIFNKKGGGGGKRKKFKMHKKYFMPLILGLLAAKSVLIPVALKALAFMSAKGLMMGFFSTVMASVLSLKGMFDNSHKYADRKDEKTQVEIIQVPTKEDHYFDDHYRRVDGLPLPVPA